MVSEFGGLMNRLVAALRRRPDVVLAATSRAQPDFSWFSEVLGDGFLSPAERSRIAADPVASHALDGSYLSVITAPDWGEGLRRAEGEPPIRAAQWVTMIPAGHSGFGLTAPEDSFPTDRVSLFTGPPDDVYQISVELDPVALASAAGGHCRRVPVRGECSPGTCGRCRPRLAEQGSTFGLVCMCVHE
jgi:hypothetical protein